MQNNYNYNNYGGYQPYYPPQPPQPPRLPFEPSVYEKKKIRSVYSTCGWLMLAAFAIMMFVAVIWMSIWDSKGLMSDEPNYMNFYETIISYFSVTIATIIVIVIERFTGGEKLKSYFSADGLTGSFILLSLIIFLGIQAAAIIIENFVLIGLDAVGLGIPALDYETEESFRMAVVGIITSSITAPLFEELLFRGCLLSRMSKVSSRFAIFATALLFGLWHQNLLQLILGFMGGLWLGYITVKSRSLIPAIICHCAANTIMECISIYEQYDEVTANTIFTVWIFAIPVIAVICGIIYYKTEKRSGMAKLPPRTEYHRLRDVPMFFSSVPMWIFMGIMLITIITGIEPV